MWEETSVTVRHYMSKGRKKGFWMHTEINLENPF